MFINCTKFKVLLKEAYKYQMLTVGLSEEGMYYIRGRWWHMEVPKEYLKKEIKAAIVALVGDLPEPGEALGYQEYAEPQDTMLDTIKEDLWARYEAAKTNIMEKTRIMMNTDNNTYVLYQMQQAAQKKAIRLAFAQCIDEGKKDEQETMSEPVLHNHGIIWSGNQMAIICAAKAMEWRGEENFLEAVSAYDLAWEQVESERLA